MAASQVGNGERAAMTGSNVGDTGHLDDGGSLDFTGRREQMRRRDENLPDRAAASVVCT